MSAVFRDRLIEAMRIRGISQTELSERSGVSKASISQYVNNVYDAKPKPLMKLAQALNVSASWLSGHTDCMEEDHQKLCDEVDLCEVLSKFFGKDVYGHEVINAIGEFLDFSADVRRDGLDLMKMCAQLDDRDRGEVCGTAKTLLKSEKYQKKESSDMRAI